MKILTLVEVTDGGKAFAFECALDEDVLEQFEGILQQAIKSEEDYQAWKDSCGGLAAHLIWRVGINGFRPVLWGERVNAVLERIDAGGVTPIEIMYQIIWRATGKPEIKCWRKRAVRWDFQERVPGAPGGWI